MAVAHSAASESHTGTIGSTNQTAFTWTHTQTGTPQGVLVFVHVANSGGNPVSSVTYGSVTLTRVSGGAAIDAAGELGRTDLFFAGSGLASGNQTITVNRANTTDIMYASAATVTAATNTNVTGIVLLEGDGTMAQQSVDDGTPGTDSLRYAAAYSGLNAPPTTGANSTSLTSIDFGNYTAAMVRETTAGQGARLVGFTTATDDRAAVHVAVRELWNRTDTETVGAFTLTGNNATLTKASPKVITGETGSFTLTGQPADLRHNPDIDGGVGTFTLAGQPASTLHNLRLDGGVGSFTLAGQPAATRHNPQLDGGVGSFTLAGQPATLSKTTAKSITTDVGKFFLPERNLRQWSEEFDNAYWTKTNASITANATAAPDGTLTADALIESTSSSTKSLGRAFTYVTDKTYTASCYFKTGPGPAARYVRLQLGNATVFGTDTYINIDPATGAIITTLGSPSATSITSIGSGWYRASITKQYTGAGITANASVVLLSGTTGSYTGDGTSGVYIWGIQYEEDGLTEYDSTGAAAATPATLLQQYRLDGGTGSFTLNGNAATLTKGRTTTAETGKFFLPERNLHQRSEEFNNGYWSKANSSVTANSTTAPDGTLTAETLIENTTNTTHIISRNLAYTTGVKYTASLYVKTYQGRDVALVLGTTTVFGGTGNTVIVFSPSTNTILLTGNSPEAFGAIDVGNGWYRIYVTKTAIASATVSGQIQLRIGTAGVYTGDGTSGAYIWGAQFEAGDLTEYDPTGAAVATPATLLQQRRLDGGVGAFAFTYQSVTLNKGKSIAGEVGSFALTGQPASLVVNSKIYQTVESFALTGGNSSLLQGYYLSGGSGNFTETGQPATFTRTRIIGCSAGVFALTGNPASLTEIGAYEINAAVGLFSLTGNFATLAQSQIMPISVGTFALTGNQAALSAGSSITAARGIFTLSGNNASLVHPRVCAVNTGVFSLGLNNSTLKVASVIDATTGSFIYNGLQTGLFTGSRISADVASIALVGQSTTLLRTWRLNASRGIFVFTGNPISTPADTEFFVQPGSFNLTGGTATLRKNINLYNVVNSFSVTGEPVQLIATANIFASSQAFVFTGRSVAFNYEQRRRVVIIF